MDEFKRHIRGFRGSRGYGHTPGKTCPCCCEVYSKVESRRLARHRLAQDTQKLAQDEQQEPE